VALRSACADVDGCLAALLVGAEFEIAWCVASLTQSASAEAALAYRAMARRCERAGMWDAAAALLAQCATIEAAFIPSSSPSASPSSSASSSASSSSAASSFLHLAPPYACDAATELLLLCARHPPPLAHASLFHQRAGAPTLVALGAAADRAVEELGGMASGASGALTHSSDSGVSMDALVRAVTALVVARRVDEALALAAPRLLTLMAPLVSELPPKGACCSFLGSSASSVSASSASPAFVARTDAWRLLAPLCGVSLAAASASASPASPSAGPGPSASAHRTAVVAAAALVAAVEAVARFTGRAQAAPIVARLCADAAIVVPGLVSSSLAASLPAQLQLIEAAYLCSLHGASSSSSSSSSVTATLVRRGADMLRAALVGVTTGASTALSAEARAFAHQLLAKLDSPASAASAALASSASASSSASSSALPLVALTGSALPSSAHRRADRFVSRISRAPIVGPILALEATAGLEALPVSFSSPAAPLSPSSSALPTSAAATAAAVELGARSELVGATEALMWARVCALSPTLSGARLEPF
jgi:hypothetical protein